MTNTTELIAGYLQTVKRRLSNDTWKSYAYSLKQFVEIVGADAPLDKKTYVKFLDRSSSMAPGTQSIIRSAISGLYKYAALTDYPADVLALKGADQSYALRRDSPPVQFKREAIEQLIAHCETMRNGLGELRDRAFVLLLVDSGLRISEACKLLRGHVDWSEAKVRVRGKGNKYAVVNISNRTMVALKDYLKARAKLDGTTGKPLDTLPLFARHDHGAGKKVKKVASSGMAKSFKGRVEEIGLARNAIRVHDLRHYFVTVVLRATGNMKMAQELARHSSMTTTSRYAHLEKSEVDQAYNEIFNQPTEEE